MKSNFGLPESSMVVYYFVKLIGLAPFTLRDDRFHPPTLLGKLYSVFLAVGYLSFVLFTFITELDTFFPENYPLFLSVWGLIGYLISIPTVLGTIITFLLMHKKIVCLMNELCTVNNRLNSFVTVKDREKIFDSIFVTIVMLNALLAIILFMIITMTEWNISTSIKFCVEDWFGFYTIFIFSQLLIYIRKRFAMLNGALHELIVTLVRNREPPRYSRFYVVNRNNNCEENQPVGTHLQRIQIIETLHIKLADLLRQTAQLFATPILLISLRSFIDLVHRPYWIYYQLITSSSFRIGAILFALFKMVSVGVQLFVIAQASVKTCDQGNAAKAVLFKVWGNFPRSELKDGAINLMFLKFSHQLLHTTVAVSALGITDLGYSFVYKIFCTVISYLIIVTQFESSGTNF